MRPSLVIIEGIDGAGKDTLAVGIKEHFANRGIEIVVTEEPTGGPIGRHIRDIIDRKLPAPATNLELQRLFVEDRRDHISSFIRPKLAAGAFVLSIRYWLSTLAYGMLEGELERYLDCHREIIGDEMIVPDLTILLDLEPEEGLRRIQAAGRQFDWFAKHEKLAKIRRNFLDLAARSDLGAITMIDAMQPEKAVLHDVLEIIAARGIIH